MTNDTSALHDLSLTQLARHLRERKVSAVETAQHFLTRTATHTELGAFLDVQPEITLAQARAADTRLAAGSAHCRIGDQCSHRCWQGRCSPRWHRQPGHADWRRQIADVSTARNAR